MVFKIGSTEVINSDGAVIHESFPQVAGTIESTEVKITASDGAANDWFGRAVAVGSGRIVVGAYQNDDNGSNSGSAYIFDLNGNQLAKITASDGAAGDRFGYSVAVGSGRIVVGAYYDADDGTESGSAYIFDLDGTQIAKITASDGAAEDWFGYSVAVGCGRIVVGAYQDDTSTGSAYIFDLDGTELAKITASDGAVNDSFGNSVAVGCGKIVIGAPLDVDGGSSSGSAYIFDLDGNQLAKITASDGAAGDRFGTSVAVGSGRIVVGADGDDDNGTDSGSAYIFDLDGTQIAKITGVSSEDYFGSSVAVGSGRIVVGAWNYLEVFNSSRGIAYHYDLDGNQIGSIISSDVGTGDRFGLSVAVASGRIVIGSYFDDDNGTNSGSAYIYSLSEDHNTYWERILDTYKY
jgi:hypothetical protein